MTTENPGRGAGLPSQGVGRILSDRERAAEFTDFLIMLDAEKLRAAGGTPTSRERWAQYKGSNLRYRLKPQSVVGGFVVWR
jgi:hypothetical protein